MEQAKKLMEEGRKLMAAGDAAAACPKFKTSYELVRGIGVQYHLARCHAAIGRTAGTDGVCAPNSAGCALALRAVALLVFDLVDSLSDDPAASAEFATLLEDPAIADAARRRVRVPELALDALTALPEGSFGRTAASFFRAHGLDPAALPRREAATEVDWLSAHLYETHDLWHVVTGFGPDVPGELGLQAFYAAQVEGPVALAILTAGMLNTLIFVQHERRARLAAIARGWEMGVRAKRLVGIDWSQRLSQPLAQIRAELGIHVDQEHDAMAALAPRPLAA